MFTTDQAGLFASGSDSVRVCLGNLLANMHRHHPRGGPGLHWQEVSPIIDSLDGERPDNAWDEQEAIKWLNMDCETGCHFEIIDGDLIMVDGAEDDDF